MPEPIIANAQAAANGLCDEIKAGGVKGMLGLDQVSFGAGGNVWECWKVEPCCGSPFAVPECAMCVLTWWCCGPCAFAKMYSTSLGQECSCVNHCIFPYFCPICATSFLRYNIRKKNGIPGNILGDCVCLCCLGPCAMCQELRSVPRSDWTVLQSPLPPFGLMSSPFKVMN